MTCGWALFLTNVKMIVSFLLGILKAVSMVLVHFLEISVSNKHTLTQQKQAGRGTISSVCPLLRNSD